MAENFWKQRSNSRTVSILDQKIYMNIIIDFFCKPSVKYYRALITKNLHEIYEYNYWQNQR